MPHIFMSHSNKDNVFTRQLTEALENAGFDIWVDFQDIPPGERWVSAIQQNLESATAIIVVLTENAIGSEWVEREAVFAMDLHKPLFIAKVDEVPLPLHLVNRQFTDFRDDFAEGVKRLAAALRELDHSGAAPRAVAPPLPLEPTEENFFLYLQRLPQGEQNSLIARDLYYWAKANADSVEFGGKITPGFHARVQVGGQDLTVFSVWAYSKLPAAQVQFLYLAEYPPYDNADLRRSTLRSLNGLMEPPLVDDKADRRPTFPLIKALDTADKLETFKQVMSEIMDNLRSV